MKFENPLYVSTAGVEDNLKVKFMPNSALIFKSYTGHLLKDPYQEIV